MSLYDYQQITNVQIVNAATAFTDESTGETFILYFNQVLWYGKRMRMSLINPNQLRHYGVTVSDDPTDNTRPFGVSSNDFYIPFRMDGTTVYFETRVPTAWELENCKHIPMTDDSLWNPSQVTIATIATTSDLPLIEILTRQNISSIHVVDKALSEEMYNDLTPYDDARFLNRMIGNVNVATAHRELHISFMGSKNRHSQVIAETVARKFRCGIETAQRTLKTTTQRGIRQTIHPLHRRYRVDHLNLHRRRLDDTFYMDTLFSKVKSLNGHTCAQLITNGTFTRIYPMESKASRNIAQVLTEFADDVGIPGTLICDMASEQTDDFDVPDNVGGNIPADAEYGDMNQAAKSEADNIEFDSFDQYLSAEFVVNRDGDVATAKVIKRAKDNEGNPIGKRHTNPLLDTREYECELEDGTVMRHNANVIAENIFAQCDDEGRRRHFSMKSLTTNVMREPCESTTDM
jgi:hypothetical protein